MGKGENKEYHLLWLISAVLLLMGIGSLFMFKHTPVTELRWIDISLIVYMMVFTVLHIWIDVKGIYIGHMEIIIYFTTSSLMVAFVVIFALVGMDELNFAYDGTHAFSALQWFFLIFYSILPSIFLGTIFAVFGKRDCELGIREVKLPISIFEQWKDDTSRQTLTDNIIEIYPRWTFTITGQEGRFIKRPIFGSAEKGGYGFKLKDGRRFGYEPTARMISEKAMKDALGNEKFHKLLKDHAGFTQDEWDSLKKAISHWYSGPDGYPVIGISFGLVVMAMQAAALSYLSVEFAIPFIIITMLLYFGPFILIHLSGAARWFFIKGTLFRMRDNGETLPDWLEIKNGQLMIKK